MCKRMSNKNMWLLAVLLFVGFFLIIWTHTRTAEEQRAQAVEEMQLGLLTHDQQAEVLGRLEHDQAMTALDRVLVDSVEREWRRQP